VICVYYEHGGPERQRSRFMRDGPTHLIKNLEGLQGFVKVSDPRDLIFSLLGISRPLFSPIDRGLFKSDYSSETVDVFT
jgi:hypothetical protein